MDGNTLVGARISLVVAGNTTSSTAGGSWSMSAATTGIVPDRKQDNPSSEKHLVLEGNRIRLRFEDKDAVGRRSIAAGSRGDGPTRRIGDVQASRSASTTVDTILFAWNGLVRARVGIPSLNAGALESQAIDTSSTGVGPIISWNSSIPYGTLTDFRDGQAYRSVKIGSQTWMAENLNFHGAGGACYGNSADSCAKYGRLYTWSQAMNAPSIYDSTLLDVSMDRQGICPDGWHVPSNTEWTTLERSVDASGSTVGTKLKSLSGWDNIGSGTDIYGFRALPAGGDGRRSSGTFGSAGNSTTWWSSSQGVALRALRRLLLSGYPYSYRDDMLKSGGFSLRCIADGA